VQLAWQRSIAPPFPRKIRFALFFLLEVRDSYNIKFEIAVNIEFMCWKLRSGSAILLNGMFEIVNLELNKFFLTNYKHSL